MVAAPALVFVVVVVVVVVCGVFGCLTIMDVLCGFCFIN